MLFATGADGIRAGAPGVEGTETSTARRCMARVYAAGVCATQFSVAGARAAGALTLHHASCGKDPKAQTPKAQTHESIDTTT